jgi:hypothetical protein
MKRLAFIAVGVSTSILMAYPIAASAHGVDHMDEQMHKLHKNLKEIAVFKAIADKLGDDVSTVRKLAEKGDFRAAKDAFGKGSN